MSCSAGSLSPPSRSGSSSGAPQDTVQITRPEVARELPKTGTTAPLGFQSDYTDPDTGAVDMGARWYTPGTGTFTRRDDIALPDTPSAASKPLHLRRGLNRSTKLTTMVIAQFVYLLRGQ
ncbi:RHS repeat-associated core domain-containing protein [Amycolatopsis minnesotensis]|uniref:RHS repeat-associated core domain-containing protein n=1 Tax=Amycolatopsis minnesotensis TaxID=337894 RepID=UPI003CD05687